MSLASPKPAAVDGAAFKIGIVAARFNGTLTEALLDRAHATLRAAGVKERNLTVLRVPGSHEVPWAADQLARTGGRHCVLALGVLIGGDTNHHELVGTSVSHALQRIAVDRGVPVINGVIVTDNLAQARARTVGKINRGVEFARAALAMAALKKGGRR
ncbi:MAG: 6,7-dimethyl-8-ribityllumazine synthase [Verrucomicrobia bacterium]|nr:6,7-dimethyl-8-ribityllumazine synthase [Verrucomicrobiota bacterium]